MRAAAAARRLDDTFRGYLTERGAKPIPLAEVTGLVTGVAGVRLAADAVLELWDGDGDAEGDRSAARRELQSAADADDRLVRRASPPAWRAPSRCPTRCRATRWPTGGWSTRSGATCATPTATPPPPACA